MEKNRLKVYESANRALVKMKGTTKLTPNILCRIGFCLSLRYPTLPNREEYHKAGNKEVREFNRSTLFGENNSIYMGLLRQWIHNCQNNEPLLENSVKAFDELTEAHLNRGVLLLAKRLHSGILSLKELL